VKDGRGGYSRALAAMTRQGSTGGGQLEDEALEVEGNMEYAGERE
jgi:hypothetical protein